MSIIRNSKGHALYPDGVKNYATEDTSFVTSDSPATVDVNGNLKRNSDRGYLVNDGPGNITVQFTHDGTNYGTAFTLKSGEEFDLTGWDIDSIKLTWVSDSAYRVHVW